MSGKLTVALAEVPSPKLAVSVKPAPLPNSVGFRSDANTKNSPPSATPKLTVPVPVLSSAPSRLAEAPRAQFAVAGSVSQTPPPPARRSSSRVTVRAPLPAPTVTRKLPSSAPSALKAPLPCPTLSRSLPRNARPSAGGGGVTVKPPVSTTVWPSGFDTVTSRAPIAAVAPITRATESWADETTVVELTVMPAPNPALAPAWKFAPVTVTVRLAPGAPELGDTLEIVGMSGKLTVALAEVPSPKLAVSVKPAPLPNSVGFRSDANTKNAPPSATPKLTGPVPELSSAPSRLPAAPSAQFAVVGSVSQTPPPPARRSSSRVTVRAPLPAWTVTRKLPSSAPSTLKAVLPCPTLSRSLPRNARPSVGGGGVTAKPPVRTTDCPSGFVTVTSRAPIAAVAPITRATESWVDETTVVDVTVIPAPNAALAPAWKLVPVTVTVRFAPCSPVLGDTLEIVGTIGRVKVALAEVPSVKLAVSVKLTPLVNTELGSAANTKNVPPSATPKLTVPVPELSSPPSRLPAAPRAQCAVAGSVSQTPPLLRSSSRVTVRAPLPAWTVTRKLPSNALSALKAVLPRPTLSRSLPRNARPSVGGGGATAKPPVRTTGCPSGFVTVTSRAPIAAVAPITRATAGWVDETTVVDVTVMPAPNPALAPAWKFAPVTVTVRFAPCSPVLGDTLEIVGTIGRVKVALAEVPSAKLAVSVKLTPLDNTQHRSAANTKNVPPSATPKLTVLVPELSSPPSRLPAAPRAQCAVAGSVSQTPPLLRSSSRVTVRAPLPAWTVTRKLPSNALSALKAVLPRPTLSRSLPRNARPSVGGGGATAKPPVRTTGCPSGFVTVTSRAPIAAVAPITRATAGWVDETTVVDVTVMPAPKAALAPAWKFVPVTVTVRF